MPIKNFPSAGSLPQTIAGDPSHFVVILNFLGEWPFTIVDKFFKKLNWLPGILLIIPFAFVGKLAENIARALLGLMQDISYYFDFMGVMGGYVAMFWEKLFMEGIGTFVFCAVSLCGPMFLNKKFEYKILYVGHQLILQKLKSSNFTI